MLVITYIQFAENLKIDTLKHTRTRSSVLAFALNVWLICWAFRCQLFMLNRFAADLINAGARVPPYRIESTQRNRIGECISYATYEIYAHHECGCAHVSAAKWNVVNVYEHKRCYLFVCFVCTHSVAMCLLWWLKLDDKYILGFTTDQNMCVCAVCGEVFVFVCVFRGW